MGLRQLFDDTSRADRPTVRTSLPFVAVIALGLLVLVVPPYPGDTWHLVAAGALAGPLFWLHRVALARATPSWWDAAGPLGTLALIAVLRDATGGADSGLSPLVAVPVLWLAVFGSRRHLTLAIALGALSFVLPVLLLGAPDYPLGEWRRTVVLFGVAVALAPVVQGVVRRLDAETRRSTEHAGRVEGIMRGATLSCLVTTDPAGRVTSWNAGAEHELGHLQDDVLGKELTSFLLVRRELAAVADELDVDTGFPVLARLAHQRAPSRIWTFVRADRRLAFVRMSVTELRDDRHRVSGYLCVAIDETEAILAQRALGLAEERWRALLDHLPETTVVVVEEGAGITVVTGDGPLARRLRDGAGRRLTELVDQAGPGTTERLLHSAFEGAQVAPVRAVFGERELEVVAISLPTAGERRQALVMLSDVSEERERERSLTRAKERAERLFDDAPHGIAVLDTDGTVLRANPALHSMLGGRQVVGRPLAACSFVDTDQTVARHLQHVLDTPDHRTETQWSASGSVGEELHVVLTSTVLGDDAGAATPDEAGGDLVLTHVVDISERYRYERQLAFLAEHDPLTGLANRRRFDQQLERHVEECRRYGARGAVLMLDLDHFKEVNDSLGHAAGDRLLCEVADVLAHRMRSTDLVARLGGDEFAVLMPHADRRSAELVAADVVERVRARVEEFPDVRGDVRVSIGGALVEPVHANGSEPLVAADTALYIAKNSGRDRYVFLSVPEVLPADGRERPPA